MLHKPLRRKYISAPHSSSDIFSGLVRSEDIQTLLNVFLSLSPRGFFVHLPVCGYILFRLIRNFNEIL